MKGNELVWRTVADEALTGRRRWETFADLAFKSGVPVSTAQLACRKLFDIGALAKFHNGFATVSVDKALTVLCAWRNLRADTIARTTVDALAVMLEERPGDIFLGGADAAIHHLGGVNTVADIGTRIAYARDGAAWVESAPPGDEVTILRLDARAAKTWDGYSSLAQTYADLFASPGWQATEFRLALADRVLPAREWDQETASA